MLGRISVATMYTMEAPNPPTGLPYRHDRTGHQASNLGETSLEIKLSIARFCGSSTIHPITRADSIM